MAMETITAEEFKKRYGQERVSRFSQPTPESDDSFLKKAGGAALDVAKSGFESLLVKPAARATEALGRTGAFGKTVQRGFEEQADTGQEIFGLDIEPIKTGGGGAKQIAGEALTAGSFLVPAAKGVGIAQQGLKQGAITGARLGAQTGATSGGLFGAGEALEEDEDAISVTEQALTGAAFGAIAGGVFGIVSPAAASGVRFLKSGAREGEELATKAVNLGKGALKDKDTKALAIFTGERFDIVESALKNPDVADIGIKGGDVALREAVQTGASASIKARDLFNRGYNKSFAQLASLNPDKLINRQKVLSQFVDDLGKAGAPVKDGKIQLDTSRIKANPGEATKIKDAYTAVQKWDDWSLTGANRLKQLIAQLTKFPSEAGGTSKSPLLGRFHHFLDQEIKQSLPKNSSKLYTKMNQKYSEHIEQYNDVVKAFNSKDPFKKLAPLFSSGNDALRQLVSFYEKTTGKQISPIVAGRALAERKQSAFGFLNPRSWIDFFIDPKTQAEIVTKIGRAKGN